MAAAIESTLGLEVQLVEGKGGIFEVWWEDTQIYSNAGRCGLLPEAEELLESLEAHLDTCGRAASAGEAGPSPGGQGAEPCCQGSLSALAAGGCCGPTATGGCDAVATREAGPRRLRVEFLYLDREQCSRCRETERVLEEALGEVGPVLRTTGIELEVHKVHVQTEEQARRLGLVSSPSIRVNGRDLVGELRESRCDCCSDLCGDEVDCRVWIYQGKEYDVPPKALLVEALLRAVYGGEPAGPPPAPGKLPDNLRRFFRGRRASGQASGGACGCE
ncbi:MAG: DUF2703 domain-containing protein [Clostridia bacterium]|jgi:glutaredoxin|nr:DUF2703 domain-containing protein [Clostridia bacterium]MDH7572463.1 DUF2703 domain-containing protein [Clostridia bacterium]